MSDGNSQPEQGLTPKDVGIKHSAEVKDPRVKLKATFDVAEKTFDALRNHAVKNGVQEAKLTHLPQVLNPDDYYLLPSETMKRELTKAGENPETAQIVHALTAKTGEIFMPEENAGNAHTLIHESIHRATYLAEKKRGTVVLEKQIAEACGFTITDRMTLNPNSPYFQGRDITEDDIALWSAFTRQVIKQTKEGLTEWVTQKGNELAFQNGLVPKFTEEDYKYPDQVEWIKLMKSDIQQKTGITEERGDAIFIEAALTGDVSQIIEQVGNDIGQKHTFKGYLNEAYYNLHLI